MNEKASTPSTFWPVTTFAILFLIGAIKDDVEMFARSRFWTEFSLGPTTSLLKDNIWLAYAAMAISFSISIFQNRKIAVFYPILPILFIFLYFCATIFIGWNDPTLATKFAVSTAALILIQVLLSSSAEANQDIVGVVKGALSAFAVALVTLNMLEYLTGHGFVPGFPRYFGTAAHPNFLGVQMAVCGLVVLSQRKTRNIALLAVRFVYLSSALWLMYLSGSRTALVVFLVGLVFSFGLANRLSKVFWAGLVLLGAAAVLIGFGFFDQILTSDVYNRATYNAREIAWTGLWSSVSQAPILGHGSLPRYSENSWLRGWATMGVTYPIIMAVIVAGFAASMTRLLGTPQLRHAGALCGIFAGLTAGSVFEGYLFDTNSLAWSAWFLSLAAVTTYFRRVKLLSIKQSGSRPPFAQPPANPLPNL